MDSSIVAAILALLGSLVGTFGGIWSSNSLTRYRLKKLEEKVDKHNQVIDRTYKLELRTSVIDEEIKSVNHRISELENSERKF